MSSLCLASDLHDLWQKIIPIIVARGEKLTIAESFTGGVVASSLTQIAGVSSFFRGSVVAYQEDLKQEILAVQPATLERFGVVSTQVAEEMALGVLECLHGTIGLATTGWAGPEKGAEPLDPESSFTVGTAALAVAMRKEGEENAFSAISCLLHLSGGRHQVQLRGSFYLLELLANQLM